MRIVRSAAPRERRYSKTTTRNNAKRNPLYLTSTVSLLPIPPPIPGHFEHHDGTVGQAAATQLRTQRRRRRRQRRQQGQSEWPVEQGLVAHCRRSEGHVQDLQVEEDDTCTWLVDMKGAGPGDSPGWRTLRTLEAILTVHYPGRLKRVLIVNASGEWRLCCYCWFRVCGLVLAVNAVRACQSRVTFNGRRENGKPHQGKINCESEG